MALLSRRERDRARMNADILDAAERVFLRCRYHRATMEEIAREAGFSVGTLYNLFVNKDGLYMQVILRTAHEVVARIEAAVHAESTPEGGLDRVIRLRLSNYAKDRLFFELFHFPPELGVQPEASAFDPHVINLYKHYMQLVEDLFQKVRGASRPSARDSFPFALSLEGILAAFMGSWAGPRQSDSIARTAAQIRDMLLAGIGSAQRGPNSSAPPATAAREICMSTYDIERLRELIAVARTFGDAACRPHLEALDAELTRARIVAPREVPPDLVTMNSKVRLRNTESGQERIVSLAFPKDVEARPENISILTPLGTALLGYRLGDLVEVHLDGGTAHFTIEQILYQPEAAGDYHL